MEMRKLFEKDENSEKINPEKENPEKENSEKEIEAELRWLLNPQISIQKYNFLPK